mmetsp:Transcript_6300/g.13758  ORF Transcript_6300/g.13758 Transcript_6300/m.13758 type:complete len:333 (+) Transcript_6300:350-1348(+)
MDQRFKTKLIAQFQRLSPRRQLLSMAKLRMHTDKGQWCSRSVYPGCSCHERPTGPFSRAYYISAASPRRFPRRAHSCLAARPPHPAPGTPRRRGSRRHTPSARRLRATPLQELPGMDSWLAVLASTRRLAADSASCTPEGASADRRSIGCGWRGPHGCGCGRRATRAFLVLLNDVASLLEPLIALDHLRLQPVGLVAQLVALSLPLLQLRARAVCHVVELVSVARALRLRVGELLAQLLLARLCALQLGREPLDLLLALGDGVAHLCDVSTLNAHERIRGGLHREAPPIACLHLFSVARLDLEPRLVGGSGSLLHLERAHGLLRLLVRGALD